MRTVVKIRRAGLQQEDRAIGVSSETGGDQQGYGMRSESAADS
jgi:hypothetical protein